MMALPSDRHAWRLADLLAGFADAGQAGDRQVWGLSPNSRSLARGAIFLACQGQTAHGLEFAEEARQRGACAILAEMTPSWSADDMAALQARLGLPVIGLQGLRARISAIADRFYGSPSAAMETFGITGTRGKTSVAHLLAQALSIELPCGIIGTIGNGFAGDLRAATEGESDAVHLQESLESLRLQGARAVAVEVSPAALGRSRFAAVHFSHAIFTSLDPKAPRHTAATGSAEAMLRLFRNPELSWGVLNLDDAFSEAILRATPPGVGVAGFSLRPDAEALPRCDLRVHARAIHALPRGLRLHVVGETPSGRTEACFDSDLIGVCNAANLLAVLTVLLTRGLPLARAARELATVRAVPGRMECFGGEQAPLVVVDHARHPEALKRALINLRAHNPRRVITIVGCSGGGDRETRPLMGAVAEHWSDGLILTDDNPGGECGEAIIEDILAGIAEPGRVRVERQRGLAIRVSIALAGTGDAVLVAGKGHETVQDMGELKLRFSDRAQVVEALREWREGHH
ncbi:MAG: UDP-N-acetylmuramoyl-L-alanyl-D-glutamate--2,6-diaminopimelate ligase [Thiocapsa sp.]|jgi:UDP-N-acetylmuramoyl-L-alanyl-D-glutamate--2,6-diaminopimelate ligase|nr:UDP-N-acetylmuramoyl-L-alanyl-D-glutamate--2,6-diaminopimelate ligase [Thiocapsa sp.]MCG6896618.1 UDP-N-acetylmuramoyl-L-alanyl-D-glutamate--2,6-diaminopimelate ligase [Thiocapsa sp.]MCG6986552.1 UDP-N-acetylmuramoyl-L-alanyl-D-glutamate--2,6-diaminopimelate ligase [Thiocapsa sp.]